MSSNQLGSTPRFKLGKNPLRTIKIIGSLLFLALLIIGGGAGYYLTQVNQDVRQQASTVAYITSPLNSFEELDKVIAANPKIMESVSSFLVCCQKQTTGVTTVISTDLCSETVVTGVRVVHDSGSKEACQNLSGFGCCQRNNAFEWLTKVDCRDRNGSINASYPTQSTCMQADAIGHTPVSPDTQLVCCADSQNRRDGMKRSLCEQQGKRIVYAIDQNASNYNYEAELARCRKGSIVCCELVDKTRTLKIDGPLCISDGGKITNGPTTTEQACIASAPNVCCETVRQEGTNRNLVTPEQCLFLQGTPVNAPTTSPEACRESLTTNPNVCCQFPSRERAIRTKNECESIVGASITDGPITSPEVCRTSTTGTGGNNTGGGNTNIGGACIALSQDCGSEKGLSNTCCGNGVCQGPSGQRICQDPGKTGDEICGAGGTCSAYYGFNCNSLSTSPTSNGALVCEQNGQLFTGTNARNQALAHAGQCGQIDKVCVGGSNPGTLCGEFQIISNSCTGPTPPPVNPTPTPTPPVIISCNSECTSDAQCQAADSRFTCYTGSTGARNCRLNSNPTSTICQPAAGPQCLSIRLNNLTTPTNTTEDPALGDSVSLTCGTVSLAQRYIFRVVAPDGTISNLTATGPTSAAFTISQAGPYAAQCQICTGAADSTCLPYEPISYSPVP